MRITIITFLLLTSHLFANNISVSNVSLTGQNTADNFTLVRFDVTWENSWRVSTGPSNWDAAWVFVKYRLSTQTTWNHASLNWSDGTGSGDGHFEPANSNISSVNDNGAGNAYGVFIHRDADMLQANVNYIGVQLRWEYGDDGVADDDSVEVCVFAVEMVYVPQGSYELGSGSSGLISFSSTFYQYPTSTNTYTVSSEAAITVGTSSGNLYYESSFYGGDQSGPIPANFPKGYEAFYMMKYEITQQQYTDFLNKLTASQDANRFYEPPPLAALRHAITGSAGLHTTSNPYIALNYVSWPDLAAYLDWAALRPMTEIEYVKACRGSLTPVSNEFAWGTTSISNATGITNASLANEVPSNSSANCREYNSTANTTIGGPVRVGCFGENFNTRVRTGASYYGIMEMSGNVWEQVITTGNSTGRSFTRVNGDGVLDAVGDANVVSWPGTTGVGACVMGGNFMMGYRGRIADRGNATRSIPKTSSVLYIIGGRGVR